MQVQQETLATLHPRTLPRVPEGKSTSRVFVARTSTGRLKGTATVTHRYVTPVDRVIEVTFGERTSKATQRQLASEIRRSLDHLHRRIEFNWSN